MRDGINFADCRTRGMNIHPYANHVLSEKTFPPTVSNLQTLFPRDIVLIGTDNEHWDGDTLGQK